MICTKLNEVSVDLEVELFYKLINEADGAQ